jgi:hypothetical protein
VKSRRLRRAGHVRNKNGRGIKIESISVKGREHLRDFEAARRIISK